MVSREDAEQAGWLSRLCAIDCLAQAHSARLDRGFFESEGN
jgi:hypothetical protein